MNGPARMFQPLAIRGREMRNRIVHAPMSVCYATDAGRATRAMAEHYGRRAEGGVGMVITENVAVSVAGRQMPLQPMLAEADAVAGFGGIAAEVRRHGALAVMQIVHAGRYAGPWSDYGAARRLAPSAIPFSLLPDMTVTPAEATEAEIAESIDACVETARLAEAAGFDGVEIHAAQGFLLSSFLSPMLNRRTDRWGGSFGNRTRLVREVTRRVRAAVGDGFIVGIQLMSDELRDGGWTVGECRELVPLLEVDGVDFILPVVSTFETLKSPENAGLFARPAFQHAQARSIKAAATVPVFANGGIREPETIERILADREADAVAMARPLFVDPDWVAKVAKGTAPRTCDCTKATCLRTQLTGSRCENWPAEATAAGYYGYGL